MSSLAIARPPAKRYSRGTLAILPAPARVARKLAARAAARLEDAIDFLDNVAACAAVGGGGYWPQLVSQATRDLEACEEALALAIEAVYSLATSPGVGLAWADGPEFWLPATDDGIIGRGIRVGDCAYLIEAAAGDMRPKIARLLWRSSPT